MSLVPGAQVGAYEIIDIIGKGGMGDVYRALDKRLKRQVAIKALPDEFDHGRERLARFQREAEVLASLNHPNIASIYELEESHQSRFLVLELVEGETLAERLERGPMPAEEALRVAVQICEAIEAAHGKNVIHRDLKPANIKLTPEGNVKLLDFGLARIFEHQPGVTSAQTALTLQGNAVVGTPAYMSPEQARGKSVDQRTDVWAFGCVLFEMLTGHRAFEGDTVSDTLAAVLSGEPDFALIPGSVTGRIPDLIRSCLAKDPTERLYSITDARKALANIPQNRLRRSFVGRVLERKNEMLALGFLLCVLTFALGASRGNPSLSNQTWSGSLLVGGSTVAWGPRVSPDGNNVAFIVIVDKQTQVALMDAESGTWDVLTKRKEPGVRIHAAWSRDGAKIYFTRGSTLGVSIYSIPVVGGEERLVLENAHFPEPLPDGSLLVSRPNGSGQSQIFRYWPEDNRIDPLPAFVTGALDPLVPLRAFADGKEAVFFGRTLTADGLEGQPQMQILDLTSKQTRKVGLSASANAALWPVAVGRDDVVLSDAPAGDLHRIVSMDRSSGNLSQALLTFTGRFSGLDMSGDGQIFVDQQNNPLEILRVDPSSGSTRVIARAETYLLRGHTVELPDDRVIVPGLVSGRPRLMLTKAGALATALIDTVEETSGPMTLVGKDSVAFLIGSGAGKSIALATLSGRIVRKIPAPQAESMVQLAASADGALLYYIADNTLWQVSTDGGGPREVTSANSVAIAPNGREMVLQRIGPSLSVRLFRRDIRSGVEEEINIRDEVRIGDVPLASNAIRKDGRILVTTALDANTWYWHVSVLDPRTGKATRIPTDFAGDILHANWTTDGKILATGVNTEGSIWRFRPQSAADPQPSSIARICRMLPVLAASWCGGATHRAS